MVGNLKALERNRDGLTTSISDRVYESGGIPSICGADPLRGVRRPKVIGSHRVRTPRSPSAFFHESGFHPHHHGSDPLSGGPVNVYLVSREPVTLIDSGPLTDEAWDALTAAWRSPV